MQTPVVRHAGNRRTAGGGRGVAVWLAVLGLACGRADDAVSSPFPIAVEPRDEAEPAAAAPSESSAGDDDTHDAGASLSRDGGFECPAPRPGATPNNAAGWARDPVTGGCCPYVNRTAAPLGWLRFDGEADCNTACLCSALEGFDGNFEDLRPVRDTLECHCSLESCPSTLEEAEQSMCAVTVPPAAVQRLVGCGMVVLRDRNGFSGYQWVFEQPNESGDAAPLASSLVGASQFSDATSSEACISSSWAAGRDFECDDREVVTCQLCGDSPGPEYPPCP